MTYKKYDFQNRRKRQLETPLMKLVTVVKYYALEISIVCSIKQSINEWFAESKRYLISLFGIMYDSDRD